jgi:hypothetical protein
MSSPCRWWFEKIQSLSLKLGSFWIRSTLTDVGSGLDGV